MGDRLPPYLIWTGKRRLQHLRKGLHDVSKRQLRSAYKQHFKDVPFARRGGVKGTTKRLNDWCAKLAECVNSRIMSPVVVAQVLKVLNSAVVPACCTSDNDNVSAAKCDGYTSASTTDAELTEGTASDSGSYESDFESESQFSDSEMESIAEDLPCFADQLDDEDIPIAPCEVEANLQEAGLSCNSNDTDSGISI